MKKKVVREYILKIGSEEYKSNCLSDLLNIVYGTDADFTLSREVKVVVVNE